MKKIENTLNGRLKYNILYSVHTIWNRDLKKMQFMFSKNYETSFDFGSRPRLNFRHRDRD